MIYNLVFGLLNWNLIMSKSHIFLIKINYFRNFGNLNEKIVNSYGNMMTGKLLLMP